MLLKSPKFEQQKNLLLNDEMTNIYTLLFEYLSNWKFEIDIEPSSASDCLDNYIVKLTNWTVRN